MDLQKIRSNLCSLSDPVKAQFLQKFFKTAPDEYAYGDIFIGISVPKIRIIAKKYRDIDLSICFELLCSEVHEERLLALLILVAQFKKGNKHLREKIYTGYNSYIKHVNNWDLVDLSADKIIGAYLFERSATPLYTLARSKNLWKRRIAIIATFYFIRHGTITETLNIAQLLLSDSHYLIHKAVGWMLREVGKRNMIALEQFIKKHYFNLPRTMLRYAIERFAEPKRQMYLKGAFEL